jgi:hypothetical protein
MLVKENAAESISDMKELLSSLCSSSPWKAEASATLNVRGGDFVSYVALSGSVNFGFVAASISNEDFLVVPLVGDSTEVKLDAITQVVEGESIPDLEIEENAQTTLSAARNKSGVDELIEFYRRIYGQNREFFNALVSRIKQQNFA